MERQYYLDLAAAGSRMPIGTHLVLHEHADHERIVLDGQKLGRVVEESARRFRMPFAFPLMDLKLEKEALLLARGVAADKVDTYHFASVPEDDGALRLTEKMVAVCESIGYIAAETDLVPVGMGIGPFSLMTKLISDPITPVFLAGDGATGEDDEEVALVERLLEFASKTIRFYLDAQIQAGAKAIILCEPAANKVYFSPIQLAQSYDVFERYVMVLNREIRAQLAAAGVDLIFHDCGELLDGMVQRFTTLDPAMMSLGSSRLLWEDAALVPKSTVLYGNLPTKQFYSDELFSVAKVRQLSDDLTRRMQATGHPFILGSECDVLSVPGHELSIKAKVEEFLRDG
jgi:uroporphyrinogen-III decarboxylase